jgi:hypothetical protein
VYLLGAGATQAEVDYLGIQGINLLMLTNKHNGEGIAKSVLKGFQRRRKRVMGDAEVDIEKLISLLAASGVTMLSNWAEEMRCLYFREILKGLQACRVNRNPKLARALFEMHKNVDFKERVENLSGIITTNHDGLLQIASQEVFGGINIGFPFLSEAYKSVDLNAAPLLLQLHGSFTWQFGVPIKVSVLRRASRYSKDMSWIPPTILKESKIYPFNKLTAMAYELLTKRCDVLRIVGSSLTQNDWNVLSLIFNAQRHREHRRQATFRIELIIPHKTGEDVAANCAYLKNLFPIGHLTDGEFDDYKDKDQEELTPEMKNIFAYWLKQKIFYHRSKGILKSSGLTETMREIVGRV